MKCYARMMENVFSLQPLSSATKQCLISDWEMGPGFVSREVGKAGTVQELCDSAVGSERTRAGNEFI